MLRVVVMGVAGSGKTTVGLRLAERLEAPFVDADSAHPPANIEKMSTGVPLTDDDRRPWLALLAEQLAAEDRIVITCSALKRAYRDRLRQAGPIRFVHLDADRHEVVARISGREDHFMGAEMVDSQFAVLEPPDRSETDVVTIDAGRPLDRVVEAAIEAVSSAG